jgi:hypothetical protein
MNNISLEKQVTRLSFVVILVDDYSGEDPIGKVNVSLENRKEKPIKTPSSYYAFVDLTPDIYTIHVESHYYSDSNEELNINQFDHLKPLIIRLRPNPSYPFPPGATLIRGTVCDPGKNVKADSKVTLKVTASGKDSQGNTVNPEYNTETKTSENGEFILYVSPSKLKELLTNILEESITFEIHTNWISISKENLLSKTSILSCNGDFHTIP